MPKTVVVTMRTKYAGPAGTCLPGQDLEVPEDEALALAEGGYAELPEGTKKRRSRGTANTAED